MSNERIDIESIEARMRLWAIGDVSDEDLALELDYIVPELKRCYDLIDSANASMKQVREKMLDGTLDWDDALFKEVVDVLLTLD